MPLEEPFVGDVRLTGTLESPTCEIGVMRRTRSSLAFENLRLSVAPREPTFIDELRSAWFHRGSMLGDLVLEPIAKPEPRPLECPPPAS